MNINDLKAIQANQPDVDIMFTLIESHGYPAVSVNCFFPNHDVLTLDVPVSTPPLKLLNMLADAGIIFRLSESCSQAVLARYGLTAASPKAEPEQPPKKCKICGKRGFKRPTNCPNFAEQGNHWQCQLNSTFVGSAPVSPLVWRNGGLA